MIQSEDTEPSRDLFPLDLDCIHCNKGAGYQGFRRGICSLISHQLQLPSRSNSALVFDPLLQDEDNGKGNERQKENDGKDTSGGEQRKKCRERGYGRDAESVERGRKNE